MATRNSGTTSATDATKPTFHNAVLNNAVLNNTHVARACAQVESAQIAIEKEEAEAALEEAIPALEEAAAALQDLKRDDITEIRSFAKPNVYVQKVCECVVHLKGGKDASWGGAKVMMADGSFLKSLVEFDKDGLSDRQVRTIH